MRLVKTLLASSRSVNELATQLAVSQYNVSKHLRVLRHVGIVHSRINGPRREYSIAPKIRPKFNATEQQLDFGCCTFRFDRIRS